LFYQSPRDTTNVAAAPVDVSVSDVVLGSLASGPATETVSADVIVADASLGVLAGLSAETVDVVGIVQPSTAFHPGAGTSNARFYQPLRSTRVFDIAGVDQSVVAGLAGDAGTETVTIDSGTSDTSLGSLAGDAATETVTFDVIVTDVALGVLGSGDLGEGVSSLALPYAVLSTAFHPGVGPSFARFVQSPRSTQIFDIASNDTASFGGMGSASTETVTLDIVVADIALAAIGGASPNEVATIDAIVGDVALGVLGGNYTAETVTANSLLLDVTVNDVPLGVLGGIYNEHVAPVANVVSNLAPHTIGSNLQGHSVSGVPLALQMSARITKHSVASNLSPQVVICILDT